MSVSEDRRPAIIPLNFWVDYEPTPGGMKEIERVEWTRKGTQNATTRETIERLSRKRGDQFDPIWESLKPYYDNWKAGHRAISHSLYRRPRQPDRRDVGQGAGAGYPVIPHHRAGLCRSAEDDSGCRG